MANGKPRDPELGAQLDQARRAAGLNRKQLAEKAGVSTKTVGRYAKGHIPATPLGAATIRAIEHACKITDGRLIARFERGPASPEGVSNGRRSGATSKPGSPEHQGVGPSPDEKSLSPGMARLLVVLTAASLVAVVVFGVLSLATRGDGPALPTAVFLYPRPGVAVPLKNPPSVTGSISGLDGREIWLAQHKTGPHGEGGLIHPQDVPCRVVEQRWNCGPVFFGDPKDAGNTFIATLYVVDDYANAKFTAYGHRNKKAKDAYQPIALPDGAKAVAETSVTRR